MTKKGGPEEPYSKTCLKGQIATSQRSSIAAITVTVISVVLLVFGVAAYLKIRHSSYGRLLDDHDYGSWGNYNNPLYDDS
ncbi:hypothetical protein MJG53_005793 [Ovis ammon polii x Ovis aries]|uniref:Uncharacterized protein n=1 Tax=Ovis ammon polii x Ovis aries TaxID=2918886 RepID=A0ACB9V6K3_9CETA|nr:hypothetical protein MJG53_005793 [Ovis ammon polii x Ovis aries]